MDHQTGILKSVKKYRVGIAFHLGITILLSIVFFSSIDYSIYEFQPSSRSLTTIYLSNFFHRDWSHLSGNIVGFLIFGLANLLIYSKSGKKRLYYISLTTLFVLGPLFIGEGVAVYIEGNAPEVYTKYSSVGFSTIVAAVIAMFPVSLSLYAKDQGFGGNILLFSTLLWLFGFGQPLLVYNGAPTALILAIGAGFVPLIYWIRNATKQSNQFIHRPAVLLMASVFLFLYGAGLMYPPDPGRVSIIAHLYGYIMGFFIVWGVLTLTVCFEKASKSI